MTCTHEEPSDPADLLPFVCELEPDDPNVVHLPKEYLGNGDDPNYNVDNVV